MTTKRADQLSLTDTAVIGGCPSRIVSIALPSLDADTLVVQYQDPYTPPDAAKRAVFLVGQMVEVV